MSTVLLINNDEDDTKVTQVEENDNRDIIRDVEAFVEENEDELQTTFYKSPRLRQFWDEEQEELESWRELYFDLVYVAVAFQLGTVIEELILSNSGSATIVFFFAQFFPLYQNWFARTLFFSRYITNSYFHGLLDISYALMVALSALFIGTRSEIRATIGGLGDEALGFNIALAFSVTSLVAMSLTLFKSLEMIFVTSRFGVREDISLALQARERRAIKNQGLITFTRTLVSVSFVCLSIIGAHSGNEDLFLIPLICGFFAELLFHGIFRTIWITFHDKHLETVPLNVGFILKRFGEFTMLMLGEGVLQIIITTIDSGDLTSHFNTFVLAFLVSSCIFSLAFYALPYEADEHAYRKSALAGLMITFLKPLTFAGIMGVGVTLKLILKNQGKLKEEDAAAKAFALFISQTVGLILLSRMVNHGFYEIFRKDASSDGRNDNSWENVNFARICYSIFIVLSSFIFLSLRAMTLEGAPTLSVSLVFFLVIFALGIIEHRVFIGEVEEEHHENMVIVSEELRDKYAKQSALLSFEERSSYVANKNGACNVHNILHFLRKKTRNIDNRLRAACTKGKAAYDWQKDVAEVEKLAILIRETFESNEPLIKETNPEDYTL